MDLSRRQFLKGMTAAAALTALAPVVKAVAPEPAKDPFDFYIGDNTLRSEVTVLQFGADPRGVRDSTQAFNAAIRSGAKVVRVPTGTYRVGGVVVDRDVHIKGDGRAQTQIMADPAPGRNAITIKHACALSGLALIGTAIRRRMEQSGIVVHKPMRATDVGVYDFPGYGIQFTNTGDTAMAPFT